MSKKDFKLKQFLNLMYKNINGGSEIVIKTWEEMPDNIQKNEVINLSQEELEFYDLSKPFTELFMGMQINYYKKLTREQYNIKQQQLEDEKNYKITLAESIFSKIGEISQEEYNLLLPEQKRLYKVASTQNSGSQWNLTSTYTYIKISEYNEIIAMEELFLNSRRKKILRKIGEISEEDYNLLSTEQKRLYKVASTQNSGPQWAITTTHTYIKISEDNEKKTLVSNTILRKTGEISQEEYNLLLPEHKRLYKVASTNYSGPQWDLTTTHTFIKISEDNEIRATKEVLLNSRRTQILSKTGEISQEEYNLLLPEHKRLYKVASTNYSGPQWDLTTTHTFIKISEDNEKKTRVSNTILSKTGEISQQDYNLLIPEHKLLYKISSQINIGAPWDPYYENTYIKKY